MAINPPPMPLQDPIANLRDWERYPKPTTSDPNENLATKPWIEWLQSSQQTLQASSQVIFTETLVDQNASIGATPFEPGVFPEGLYRATFYARVTTPSVSGSSLEVSFLWTDDTVACSATSASMIGNLVTTVGSGTFMFFSDPNSPISYSTTYSTGPGVPIMVYKLYTTLERMGS